MLKRLLSKAKQKIDRSFNQFVASMFVITQLLFPMAMVAPVHATNSPTNVPFSDSFGSTDVNNVTNWDDDDGNGSDTRIEGTSSPRAGSPTTGHVRIDDSGWICRTVNATGYEDLSLAYYWRSSGDTEDDDDGHVEYKVGGNCSDASGWTSLQSHNLDGQNSDEWDDASVNLPGSLDGETFNLRFRSDASASDEQFRIDDVAISGTQSEPQKNQISDWCGPYDGGVKFDNPNDDTIDGIEADFSNDDEEVDIESVDVDKTVELVVVKAGSTGGNGGGGNQTYDTAPFNDLTAPGGIDISHVIVCYNETDPVPNPAFPIEACGLDVALVLDNSTSIDAGEMTAMKNAVTAFTNALDGTPTEFSVTRFATTAAFLQSFTPDAATANVDINAIPVGGGFTNWEDGLTTGASGFPHRSNFDLVLFASDGDPTTSGDGSDTDTGQPNEHLAPAVAAANAIKTSGARILALGIGDPTVSRLQAISGPSVDTGSVLTSDVITTDFAGLAADLAEFAEQLCGGTITTTKLVDHDNNPDTAPIPAEDWTFTVDGDEYDTDTNGQTQAVEVDPGEHSVTETVKDGYEIVSAECKLNGQTIGTFNGTNAVTGINVGATDIVTCTFVNAETSANLRVTKYATNDNGGTILAKDFELKLNGNSLGDPSVSSDLIPNSSASYSNIEIEDGVLYTVSEDLPTGYANTSITCFDITDGLTDAPSIGHPFTAEAGHEYLCNVSNNDIAPKLTVTKTVTNDNGGTLQVVNFPLYVGAIQVVSGAQNGFNAGGVLVSETNQAGYTAGQWGGDCDLGGNITLQLGGVYTCTITNDDQPAKIIVDKVVVNDNDGKADDSEWDLFVNQTEVNDEAENTFNGNAQYTISESGGPSGYTQTSIVCQDVTDPQNPVGVNHPFTAELGHTYRCTVTNDDQPAKLIVKKVLINDNGGTTPVTGFSYKLNGGADTPFEADGENEHTVSPGVHSVYENSAPGYETTYDNCKDVSIANGETKTCTITNNDKPAKLRVKKIVQNNDGGNAQSSHFTMLVDGSFVSDSQFPGSSSGTTVTLNAGNYNVTEIEKDGYEPHYSDDCSGTIASGQEKTCIVTNKDIAPQLRLKKQVVNDNGGDADATDWYLRAAKFLSAPTINEQGYDIGDDKAITQWHDIKANTKYFLSESGPNGYAASDWYCDGGKVGTFFGATYVEVGLGEEVTCKVINDDKAPKLKLIKLTYPDEHYKNFDFEVINKTHWGADDGHFWNVELDTDDYSDTPQWEWIELETAGVVKIEEDREHGWKVIPVCFGNELDWDLLKLLANPAEALNYPSDRTVAEEVEIGETLICIYVNIELGDLKVTKFHDLDQDGYWDEGEPALPGWDIHLKQKIESHHDKSFEFWHKTTNYNGEVKFRDLLPSIDSHFVDVEYELWETLQPGWHQSNIYCDDERYEEELGRLSFNGSHNDEDVTINPGEKTRCYIGNYQDSEYTITKTNDAEDALLPGESVNFEIVVTNPVTSGIIYDAIVYDLMPEGLTYVNGSAQINGVAAVPEPDYSGPGEAQWQLGDLNPGDVKTLTYTAVIDDDTPAGTYTNVAWTDGCERLETVFQDQGPFVTSDNIVIDEKPRCYRGLEQVFGNCDVQAQPEVILYSVQNGDNGDYPYPEEEECDPFVESSVTVAAVLGEETAVLAETGTPAILAPFVGLAILTTAIGVGIPSDRRRRLFGKLSGFGKNITTGLMALVLSFAITTSVSAASLLRVADLADTTTADSVSLSYSVANTEQATHNAVLNVDGPGSNDITDLAGPDFTGSHTDSFGIDLPVDGTYKITLSVAGVGEDEQTIVKETPEPVVVTSDTVSVTQNGTEHTVAITVPSGSDAETVQIYASTDPNSQGELVGEIPATPGALQTFVHNAANAAGLYFTVRLIDGDGNSTTLASNEAAQTAENTSADDGVVDEVAAVDDNSADDEDGQEQGATDDQTDDDGGNTVLVIVGLAAVAGALYYVFGRRTGLEE